MKVDLRRLSAIAAGLLVLVLAFAASATATTQEVTSPAAARASVVPFIPGTMPGRLPAPTTLTRANTAIRSGQPPFKAGLANRQLAKRLGILAGPAEQQALRWLVSSDRQAARPATIPPIPYRHSSGTTTSTGATPRSMTTFGTTASAMPTTPGSTTSTSTATATTHLGITIGFTSGTGCTPAGTVATSRPGITDSLRNSSISRRGGGVNPPPRFPE